MPKVKSGQCSTGAASLHVERDVTLLICPHGENPSNSWYIQARNEDITTKIAEDLGISDLSWN